MKDKVCLVTGATSGIGFETAMALAKMGATVVVGARDMEKASEAVIKIRTESNNSNVEFLLADLFDFVEVERFAKEFKEQYKRLDVLVNNAGGIFKEFDTTPQDIEMTMALNLFSPYLLTGLLLDVLYESTPARIINVSSMVHKMAKNDYSHLDDEKHYKALDAYAKSKLALLHFNNYLADKLAGSGVVSNAMHPGWVKSNFGSGFYSGFYAVLNTVFKPVQISPLKGAETIIWMASSPEVEKVNGIYFVKKRATATSQASYSKNAQKYIWELCEQQTCFTYEFKGPEKKEVEEKIEETEKETKGDSDDKPGGA